MAELTDKDLTKIRKVSTDALKTDVHVDILSIDKVFILENKKNKENYLERSLVIVSSPGRVLFIKSGLVGKSVEHNILILTLNELKHFKHNGENFCVSLTYNEGSQSIVFCSKDSDLINTILHNLFGVCYMVSQCLSFEPSIVNVNNKRALNDKRFKLSSSSILGLAYQMVCIIEDVLIDRNLLELFVDDDFHSNNHIFDINYILRHYTSLAMKQSANRYRVNPREVMVMIHALQSVCSFSHIHLDGIRINGDIAQRLAKLLARNDSIQSIALRKTQINAQIFYLFNKTMDEQIIKLNKKAKILDHLTLSHNDLQIESSTNKNTNDSCSFFESMDGNVICVRKLYVSRCNLNRDLLSQMIDSAINYKYLSKIDLSFNDLSSDSLITFKLSQFVRKILSLESLLLRDCKLKLSFLQDIVAGYASYRKKLMFLDLGGNYMTHYGAIAIGQILQNTLCAEIKIDLTQMNDFDQEMIESILFAPFRSSFKKIYIELVLSDIKCDDLNILYCAFNNMISFAVKHSGDCNGIQCIDLSRNRLCQIPEFFGDKVIGNFYSLESLILDANFKYKNKKGLYSDIISCLCSSLSKLNKLSTLSIRGEWANNLYLTFDDLLPLLTYIGTKECKLSKLYLDGNRIKDDGCKIVANSLSAPNKCNLRVLSIEDNKCSFKGFQSILESIYNNQNQCKLCDIPIHSILDDPNFKKKVKKHEDKIRDLIKIVNKNRLDDIKQNEEPPKTLLLSNTSSNTLTLPGMGVTSSKNKGKRHSIAPPIMIDDNKTNDNVSPSLRYQKATQHKMLSNVDKLAAMMLVNTPNITKRKAIKNDDEKESKTISISISNRPKQSKTKIVSSGVDAALNKVTISNKNKNSKNNAKSKRKKRTRKKIAI